MQLEKERLEIRVPSPMLASLRREAKRRSVPVAELVREAISSMLGEYREARLQAATELFEVDAPVANWETMKQQISEGYSNSLES